MAREAQVRKNEARERARIRREQERRKARQRKILTYSGVIVGVIAVIAGIVIVGVLKKSSNKNVRVAASPAIVSAIAGVPAANLDTVGLGSVQAGLKTISNQTPLVADGKPEVLYIGGEFCPHCAIERWAMAVALSRFGTFTGLETTRSAVNDGNIATLTFLNAKYTSQYVTFTSVEAEDRASKPLQTLSDAQKALTTSILGSSSLGFPFIDFGNKYLLNGDQVDFNVLSGMNAEQIAQQLSNPTSAPGKAIMGSANSMTAAICKLTNNQPSNVCSSSAVTAGAASLPTG